jgi:acyl-CoA thioesterase
VDSPLRLITTEVRPATELAKTIEALLVVASQPLPVEDDAPNNPHARFRFYHQLDCRIADGDRYWSSGLAAGPARYARWLRYKTPQCDADGHLDRLALPPLIDTMPTALHRAIGPVGYRFYAPSLDLTTYVVDDTRREWLLVAVTVRRAHAGWAIADAEVWDDEVVSSRTARRRCTCTIFGRTAGRRRLRAIVTSVIQLAMRVAERDRRNVS